MATTAQTSPVREGFILPADLSVYIGKKTLVKLILEAIERLEAPECGCPATTGSRFQPARMLTLLTYCYATGVYACPDIELGMQRDQMIRYLCGKNGPNPSELLEFRRYGRDRIKACLETVLRRVWELRFCDEDACPTSAPAYRGASFGRWLNMRPTPDFASEAEQRIVCAVRADSMAMDW